MTKWLSANVSFCTFYVRIVDNIVDSFLNSTKSGFFFKKKKQTTKWKFYILQFTKIYTYCEKWKQLKLCDWWKSQCVVHLCFVVWISFFFFWIRKCKSSIFSLGDFFFHFFCRLCINTHFSNANDNEWKMCKSLLLIWKLWWQWCGSKYATFTDSNCANNKFISSLSQSDKNIHSCTTIFTKKFAAS